VDATALVERTLIAAVSAVVLCGIIIVVRGRARRDRRIDDLSVVSSDPGAYHGDGHGQGGHDGSFGDAGGDGGGH
jgi:hypothetical protein